MKPISLMPTSPDSRVEKAIEAGVDFYINKLANGYLSLSVEAPMQHHIMRFIGEYLEMTTISKNERFVIDLEKNIPLPGSGKADEVDGVIEYYVDGSLKGEYLIEFKYKKPRDGGPNSCNIPLYVDIQKLEQQRGSALVKGCYFIFLTSDEDFTFPGRKPTANRMVFPAHDGYVIEAREYRALVPAAIKDVVKNGYPNGAITFTHTHELNYQSFTSTSGDNYWLLMLKI